jgi:tetratricopeptide (TPR) repeat protein
MRRVVWVTSLLCWWATSSVVLAQSVPASSEAANDNVARGLFQAGTSAYEAGNYKDALQFYEQAYERSPRPQLLYNIGQAADRLREDNKALWAFRAYLANAPNAENRAAVQQRVDALEGAREARGSKPVESAPAPIVPQPAPVPTPAQTAAQSETARPAPTQLTTEPSSAANAVEPAQPVTKRWWFWTGIGAVVGGGAVAAVALSHGGGSAGQTPLYEGNADSLRGP